MHARFPARKVILGNNARNVSLSHGLRQRGHPALGLPFARIWAPSVVIDVGREDADIDVGPGWDCDLGNCAAVATGHRIPKSFQTVKVTYVRAIMGRGGWLHKGLTDNGVHERQGL